MPDHVSCFTSQSFDHAVNTPEIYRFMSVVKYTAAVAGMLWHTMLVGRGRGDLASQSLPLRIVTSKEKLFVESTESSPATLSNSALGYCVCVYVEHAGSRIS